MAASVEDYVLAFERENTVRSYASALKDLEEVWRGLLPTTTDAVARYVVEHATRYRLSTRRLHLAALSRWHADNGFADPTRAQLIQKVLRGIKAMHAALQRRARPLHLDVLESVTSALRRCKGGASPGHREEQGGSKGEDRSLTHRSRMHIELRLECGRGAHQIPP